MLEKILNAEGTERLSEKELKSINGGNYPPGICGYLPNGKPIKC
jgi:bacteriocin-like protein